MDRQKYVVSGSFYSLLSNDDSKPILIVDDLSSPRRVFLVKYLLGAAGENTPLIFRNELTGYDYEQQMIYRLRKHSWISYRAYWKALSMDLSKLVCLASKLKIRVIRKSS